MLEKSIRASFIALKDMTAEDWQWLGYEFLRETAINRLATAAEAGIVGFFDVRIVQKAGPAKRRYLQPATRQEYDTYQDTGVFTFSNSRDVNYLSPPARRLSGIVDGFATLAGAGVAWRYIVNRAGKPGKNPEMYEELRDLTDAGHLDNLEDVDAALMTAIYLFDKYEVGWLEDVINELESAIVEM